MKVISSIEFSILDNGKYRLDKGFTYYSTRYGKHITVPAGYISDGATGAFDIASRAWWVHDMLCQFGKWDDGTQLCNWQCSQVLQDILVEESPKGFWKRAASGRWWQSRYWFWSTLSFGGGEARKNGMFKVATA